MKEVSSKFQEKMQDSLRSWVPKIEIDGNEIPCDIKTGLAINLGSCGPEEFNIGAVFVPSITATISDCSVALQNKEIKLYMGLVLDDGTIEYVPIGYFTVEKPNKGKFDTSFTAYGRLMSKMGGLYESELTYPATINSVITEISTKTGVKINLVGLTGTGLIPTKPTELNYRETAQMIAGLLGGFVTENSKGEVLICKYELDDALTVDTAICYEYPFVHDENYSVTGLSVNTGTEEFSYGTPNINMTNGYMTASLFETCKGNIMGFSYMPGSVKFLGDIRLDPWNSLKVTDDDKEYQIPCMDIVHIWDGGLITTVQAPGTTEAEDESGFSGSIKTIENKLSKAAGVTGALETLFEIDKINGTIKLQAGKLLEILSGGQLIVEADNYSLNEDGTVTITGGIIGGFQVRDGNIIISSNDINDDYYKMRIIGNGDPAIEITKKVDGGYAIINANEEGVHLSGPEGYTQYGNGEITSKSPIKINGYPAARISAGDMYDLINALGTGGDEPKDDDYFISQYVGGGETTKTYHRRKMSKLAEYIYTKMVARQKTFIPIEDFQGTGTYDCYMLPFTGLCFARIQLTGKAISSGTTTVIGTVEAGVRPSKTTALSAWYTGTSTHVKASINANGQIRILSSAALTTSSGVYISGMWLVD